MRRTETQTPSFIGPVLVFTRTMLEKLYVNRHKGDREGWQAMSPEELIARCREELEELDTAVAEGDSSIGVLLEAADVANMALMIADSYAENQG